MAMFVKMAEVLSINGTLFEVLMAGLGKIIRIILILQTPH
jgi:hypothetical protein